MMLEMTIQPHGARRRLIVAPARISDVYVMASNLRDADREEIVSLGIDPRKGIRDSFLRGIMNKCAFIDGELAAMWGLGGTLVSNVGHPWLMTTPVAEQLPVQFLKLGSSAIAEMLALRPQLENIVPASYGKAVRLVRALGFTLEEAKPTGPKGALFHRFYMGHTHGH